jgi:hypothetical protein
MAACHYALSFFFGVDPAHRRLLLEMIPYRRARRS